MEAAGYLAKIRFYYGNRGGNEKMFLEALSSTLEGTAGLWYISQHFESFENFCESFEKEYITPL